MTVGENYDITVGPTTATEVRSRFGLHFVLDRRLSGAIDLYDCFMGRKITIDAGLAVALARALMRVAGEKP